MRNRAKLDTFTTAYIDAMLWSETDDDDRPLDRNYSASDIDADTLARIVVDCDRFQSAFAGLFDDDSQAGHDFWLDRVGAGCGALDRACECDDTPHLGSQCPRNILRHAGAHWMGHVDAYLGDDESIYMSPDPWSAAMHARRLDRRECEIVDRYLATEELPMVK